LEKNVKKYHLYLLVTYITITDIVLQILQIISYEDFIIVSKPCSKISKNKLNIIQLGEES